MDIQDEIIKDIINSNKINTQEDLDKHMNITCISCKSRDFNSYRYKCLICFNYDLCSSCFEKNITTDDHLLSHPVVRFEQPNTFLGNRKINDNIDLEFIKNFYQKKIHENFCCDVCELDPIKAIRFKCSTCYDYDLCLDCFEKKKENKNHLYLSHTMVIEDNDFLKFNSNDVELFEVVGKGGFGIVYKAKIKSRGTIVACKKISIDQKYKELNKLLGIDLKTLYISYARELDAYSEFKCQNIIKMIGYWKEEDQSITNMYILTEYMEKKSLSNLLKSENLTLRTKLKIAVDIITGMVQIHKRNFIHRDIRPDNILISSNYEAKIGDFGIAKILDKSIDLQSLIGFRPYMPPEFYTGKYDQKLDVFTFGLTLIELFDGEHELKIPSILIRREPKIFKNIINKLIDSNAENRLDSSYIYRHLKSVSFIINKCFETVLNDYECKSFDEKNNLFMMIYEKVIEMINLD